MLKGCYNQGDSLSRWKEIMQKTKIQQVVNELPEEFDVDEFFDKVILLERIEAAERRLANGEGISHEEARERMAAWLK
jgi:hypothetical protein